MKIIVTLMLSFFVASSLVAKPKPSPKPDVKALLITGGCCHDYDTQQEIIPSGIDDNSKLRVQWTILHQRTKAGDVLLDFYKNPDWAKGYDVVVHNECFAHISDEEYIAGILQPHLDGVPAVMIHCSMHCYREGSTAEDWWKFCGVHSPGHGAKHPFEVRIVNPDHEITEGMSNWTTPQGELYFIKTIYPTMTSLAESTSEKNGESHSTVWVNEYGPNKTRVFATSIGHHNETMLDPNYMDMLTRGFLWAAGKPVSENVRSK
ncbi:MAG: ThuA domain-containing protein [Verrucomicrobiota bacterium]